jgi:hypothetical protein
VIPAPVHNYSAIICQGSSYNDEHFINLTTAGFHSKTLQTDCGCDSIVRVNLSFAVSPVQALCMISVGSDYRNEIVWRRQGEVVSYNIYREGSTAGIFELIANIPFEEPNRWIDTGSDARVRSHSYQITAIDSCGNESARSPIHKTMHLTINQGQGSWNLIWTPYEGASYSTYRIHRAVGDAPLTFLTEIPASLTTYADFINTGESFVYYMVEILLNDACDVEERSQASAENTAPLRSAKNSSFASIRSNVATNNTGPGTNIVETWHAASLQIHPNPVTDLLHIQTDETITQIVVLDLNGRELQSLQGNHRSVNMQALSPGYYIVRIHTETAIVPVKIVKR